MSVSLSLLSLLLGQAREMNERLYSRRRYTDSSPSFSSPSRHTAAHPPSQPKSTPFDTLPNKLFTSLPSDGIDLVVSRLVLPSSSTLSMPSYRAVN